MKQRLTKSTARPARWHLFALFWAFWVILFCGLTIYWATENEAATAPVDADHVLWLSVAVYLIGLTSWRMAQRAACFCHPGPPIATSSAVAVETILGSLFWAVVLGAPLLNGAGPTVGAPYGWMLAAALLFSWAAALVPAMRLSGLLLRQDFARQCTLHRYVGYARQQEFDARRYPRRAEFALWSLLLFPVYPWLRAIRWRSAEASYAWLMLLAGGFLTVSVVVLHLLGAEMRLQDWNAAIHLRAFPLWRYLPGLLAVVLVYFCARRLAAIAAERIFPGKYAWRRRWLA